MPNDEGPKAFFISPIGEAESDTRKKADQTLKHLVRKAVEPEPLNCKVDRADEDTDPGSITPRMLNAIRTADLVVIDLTDHNPNVFYEMAIAHGYRRPCVHIITEGQKIPFDVKDMNTVQYTVTDPDKLDSAVAKLRGYAKTALENGTTTTPLSAAEKFSVVQSSTDPTVEALVEITARLDDLQAAVWEGFRSGSIRLNRAHREEIQELGNPVVFTKDYDEHSKDALRRYQQGTSGLVTRVYEGPSGITHVDVRLPEGRLLRKVPVDYFLP